MMIFVRLQLQRLAEYERYLGQDARNLQVDNGNGGNVVGSGAVLQRAQLEGDLHRIQELFPGDNLKLHERDVLTTVRCPIISRQIHPMFDCSLIFSDYEEYDSKEKQWRWIGRQRDLQYQ